MFYLPQCIFHIRIILCVRILHDPFCFQHCSDCFLVRLVQDNTQWKPTLPKRLKDKSIKSDWQFHIQFHKNGHHSVLLSTSIKNTDISVVLAIQSSLFPLPSYYLYFAWRTIIRSISLKRISCKKIILEFSLQWNTFFSYSIFSWYLVIK